MNIVNSVFRYPGGKKKLLPVIMFNLEPLLIGEDSFCDAFVGGGSVALAVASKYKNMKIFINDKDYWIYSFWDIVAGSSIVLLKDLLDLLKTEPTLELFYKLKNDISNQKLQCAYKAIFFNRTTFSGILKSGPIGGKEQKSKYNISCRFNYQKISQKIIEINKLLSGRTVVSNEDINIYLKDINCPTYLDPPYFKVGKDLYNEYMNYDEHKLMSSILRDKKKWLLSYDEAEEIKELYKYAVQYKVDTNYCINGQKINWSKKTELLISPKI